ncbi:hypothetical protein ANCDUO_09220 [Ancylostoma duodenale]|uniref:Uncharacterized protein n=1 Tax=Ancylostoma duodenale TaxID=51022 RepID=A0A0C2GTP1_9BILA|nr:hypothetical protein ANCDUO_09220 [Ancylostoma duodenale]
MCKWYNKEANGSCRQLLSAIDGTADIRMQDIAFEFREVSKNPVAQEFMLTFLIENWELIYERFGGQFKPIERVLRICLGKIRSYGQIMMISDVKFSAYVVFVEGPLSRSLAKPPGDRCNSMAINLMFKAQLEVAIR